MKPQRILAIILVIGAGLVGSYYIIRSSMPSPDSVSAEGDGLAQISQKILGKNPIEWLKNQYLNSVANQSSTDLSANDSQSSDSQNASSDNNSSLDTSVNLTELVAKSLFGKMQQMDTNGSNPFSSSTFDPNSIEGKALLSQTLSEMQGKNFLFNQGVKDSDLKISNDNSKEAKLNYVNSAILAIYNNLNDDYNNPAKGVEALLSSDNDASHLQKVTDTYKTIYQEFLNMTVPSDLASLHKRYISFMENAETVYLGIIDYKNDPIKTGLFLPLVPKLINLELSFRQEFKAQLDSLNK